MCLNDGFEFAWRNRFHAGWRIGEMADFNLEYKGSIQQFVSADTDAYKVT